MKSYNSYEFGRREFHNQSNESGPFDTAIIILLIVATVALAAIYEYHLTPRQLVEIILYIGLILAAVAAIIWHFCTIRSRRENAWPHPRLHISAAKDEKYLEKARKENKTIIGYDVHGDPWYWPDETRAMQGILLGKSGMGKTTTLLNIIIQDLHRVIQTRNGPRRMPMIIMSGKADLEDLDRLLPEIELAGRMHQLRIIDLANTEQSARYNPLHATEKNYEQYADIFFEALGLDKSFFTDHQQSYFLDIIRVLIYTGKRINVHDVLVMAMDPDVMCEQIRIARNRMAGRSDLSEARHTSFEMSVMSLLLSLEEKERIKLIQGLLNPLKNFLRDDLAVITSAYEDVLTLDDVVENDLILYVRLNDNNRPMAAQTLGLLLLHDLQRLIGDRYEDKRLLTGDLPLLSVILDEFAPFAYPRFSQVVQQARGSKTAFLFALQDIQQLKRIGVWFANDVASAPNTIMLMFTQDEETAKFFINAASVVDGKRLTETVARGGFFGRIYRPIGFGSETPIKEPRVKDEHIKTMPPFQMHILMTDKEEGPLYGFLHIRKAFTYQFPIMKPMIYSLLRRMRSLTAGARLRFKEFTKRKRGGNNSEKGGRG